MSPDLYLRAIHTIHVLFWDFLDMKCVDGHTKGKEKQCSELNFSLFLFVPSLFFSFLSCAGVGFESNSTLHPLLRVYLVSTLQTPIKTRGSVCKVRTQDPENLDEEVKSLVTAWRIEEPSEINLFLARFYSPGVTKTWHHFSIEKWMKSSQEEERKCGKRALNPFF